MNSQRITIDQYYLLYQIESDIDYPDSFNREYVTRCSIFFISVLYLKYIVNNTVTSSVSAASTSNVEGCGVNARPGQVKTLKLTSSAKIEFLRYIVLYRTVKALTCYTSGITFQRFHWCRTLLSLI